MSSKRYLFKPTVAVICLFVITIGFSTLINAYNLDSYIANYQYHKIDEATCKSMFQLEEITADLISFIKNGDEKLINRHFNQREVMHMKDVYNLFKWLKIVILVAVLIISFIFADEYRNKTLDEFIYRLIHCIFWVYGFVLLLAVLLFAVGFDDMFILFHKVFFANDLWILDPQTDMMIVMLPSDFFMNTAFNIVVISVISVFVIQLLFFAYVSIRRRKI